MGSEVATTGGKSQEVDERRWIRWPEATDRVHDNVHGGVRDVDASTDKFISSVDKPLLSFYCFILLIAPCFRCSL